MKEYCQTAFDLIKENHSHLQAIIDNPGPISEDFDLKKIYADIISCQNQIMSVQPTMQLFLMHIIQSYHIKFHVDLNELPDWFDDDDLLKAHAIIRYHQWFGVIHDIILICLDRLDKAENKLNKLLATL